MTWTCKEINNEACVLQSVIIFADELASHSSISSSLWGALEMPFSPKAAVFCTALGGDLLNLCPWGVQPRLVPGGLLHRGELLDLPGLAVQAQGNVVESGWEEEEKQQLGAVRVLGAVVPSGGSIPHPQVKYLGTSVVSRHH